MLRNVTQGLKVKHLKARGYKGADWMICFTTETSEEFTFGYHQGREISLPSQGLSFLDNATGGINANPSMAPMSKQKKRGISCPYDVVFFRNEQCIFILTDKLSQVLNGNQINVI
jgi:hypothetical protein